MCQYSCSSFGSSYLCTFCSKPTCFCERTAVHTLDVPKFIHRMVMIQSERVLIKRKNFSPCIEEECMRSKIWKSIQKVIEGKKQYI